MRTQINPRNGVLVVLVLGVFLFAREHPRAGAITFTNTAPITIPAVGLAAPYGSTINVTGVTGVVQALTLGLNGLTHTQSDDLGIVLVSPTGQALIIMDGAGSGPVSGATLIFSDAAPAAIPDAGLLTNGFHKPGNHYIGDWFDPPGPGTTARNPGPAGGGTATLGNTFTADPNGTWTLYVKDFASGNAGSIAGGWALTIVTNDTPMKPRLDYDGDGITDPAVLRVAGSNLAWFIRRSSDLGTTMVTFGLTTESGAPMGDFDGDGRTDLAVWRTTPAPPTFHLINSGNSSYQAIAWGLVGDNIHVVGDYDDDGKDDLGVFRPSTATFFIRRSSNGSLFAQQFGLAGDKAAYGDFDGDSIADLAVRRGGTFFLQQSSAGFTALAFGLFTDQFVPLDYDGDSRSDVATVRQTSGQWVWWIRSSNTAAVTSVAWGLTSDQLVPGDYDGDGRTDLAVFRPSTATFFIRKTSDGQLMAIQWGLPGDTSVGRQGTLQ